MSDEKSILNRSYLAMLPFFLMAVLVLVKLCMIQYGEGPELRAEAQNEVVREINIKADRGNIYSSDGKLLATSMPVYDLYMDPITVDEETFFAELPGLAKALAAKFPERNKLQWEKYLNTSRKAGSRYVKLAQDVSFTELQNVRQFPIFKLGRFKGGLIFEQKNYRKMPLGKIAERTIGYDRLHAQTGIEGAFSSFLSGTDGLRLKQKVSNGNWKPVSDHYEVEPKDGLDVVTTINTRMQDVVHHELLKALERFEADHGCAVLMEVETGAIRAIANLGRTEKGTYFEKRNYAVWEDTEPGSTFKLASVMIALEDGVADTNTILDTEDGIFSIYGKDVRDSEEGGYGKVSLKHAFEVSSNVGIVKLIYNNYKHDPGKFIDRLYNIGIHKKLGLPIKGEGTPEIPKPGDQKWSGISLPWIAFGYQVSFTPLQILSFYNAIANQGKMVKPRFVEEIRQHGRTVEERPVQVINPAICSRETLLKLQDMLEGVVTNGTASREKSKLVSMAGKTGTCQLNYWKEGVKDYQASFAGYFPADNPRYSCIVVINKPNYHQGYYGSKVAFPVFKAIAENIYLDIPQDWEPGNTGANVLLAEKQPAIKELNGMQLLPDLTGMDGSEVVPALENLGYRVKIEGIGKVKWQYPPAGTRVSHNRVIELKMG